MLHEPTGRQALPCPPCSRIDHGCLLEKEKGGILGRKVSSDQATEDRKVRLPKARVFPGAMHGWERWTLRKSLQDMKLRLAAPSQ